VASTLKLSRNRAAGFIDGLGGSQSPSAKRKQQIVCDSLLKLSEVHQMRPITVKPTYLIAAVCFFNMSKNCSVCRKTAAILVAQPADLR
jgi:hypothetical protein